MTHGPETAESVPQGVGRTAIGVALVRAEESRRPDRLFDDPYAEAFVAAAPHALPTEHEASHDLAAWGAEWAVHATIRTRFFDDYLLAAGAAGCRQVVLLAAGLDTRALRLDWPEGTRVFELDLPDMLTFKERVLADHPSRPAAAPCERTTVAVDLREDWPAALTGAGFDPSQPTAWLAEGLLIYLSASEVTTLLTRVGDLSVPGSQFSCEHRRTDMTQFHEQARKIPALDFVTSLWRGGLGTETPDWLTRHGWEVQLHERAELAATYGRPVTSASDGGFLTATR